MSDEFTLVDFALIGAPPARVAQALGRVVQASARGSDTSKRGRGKKKSGLLRRIVAMFRRQHGAERSAPTLLLQPEGHLPAAPLARLLPDDLGFGAGETPFRLTAPLGSANLTLIEFREGDTGTSSVCLGLSGLFSGADVFYFRLSGLHHPGSETVFQIYRNGHAIRRVASVSAAGTTPEAEWQVTDSGMPHPVEADSLPPVRARAWEIMTPERQGAILSAMGIDPDTLFTPAPDRMCVELSFEAGGRDLQEIPALGPAAPPDGPSPAGTHPKSAQTPQEVAEGQDNVTPGAGTNAEAQNPARTESTPDAPEPDPTWDAEVTSILVTAVAHALPEEEQVPWLTHLTAQLEAGDVQQALAEARALIEMGNRPLEDRARDSARLDALFGADAIGGPGDAPQ